MRFDPHYNVLENTFIRAIFFVISVICLVMGTLTLKSKLFQSPINFDHTFQFGIASTVWGVILLFLSVRKFFRKTGKD
jgi:hypothetical protein